MGPDGLDSPVDAGTVRWVEVVEAGGDPADEGADAPDLFLRGHRFGARPVVDVSGGKETLSVAEQVIEVGVQVGQVGHVGAEVVASGVSRKFRKTAGSFDENLW